MFTQSLKIILPYMTVLEHKVREDCNSFRVDILLCLHVLQFPAKILLSLHTRNVLGGVLLSLHYRTKVPRQIAMMQ